MNQEEEGGLAAPTAPIPSSTTGTYPDNGPDNGTAADADDDDEKLLPCVPPPPFGSYAGCVIAGPMVRVSTLGFRLLAARSGADVVFSEETVAVKLAKCVREIVRLPLKVITSRCTPPQALDDVGVSACAPLLSTNNAAAGTTSTTSSVGEGEQATKDKTGGSNQPENQMVEVVEYVHYEEYKNEKRRAVVAQTIARHTGTPSDAAEKGLVLFSSLSASAYPEGAPSVLQLGAADPHTAAKAAALVSDDFDGIDVNMGCPKKFSVDNGMGAALMSDVDRAADILVAVHKAINSPKKVLGRKDHRTIGLSFKTRLFETVDESVRQIDTILSKCSREWPSSSHQQPSSSSPYRYCCVHSVTLHCRQRPQRSEMLPDPHQGAQAIAILRQKWPQVQFVYNGSIRNREEAETFLAHWDPLFNGVMIARGAMWNPTECFGKMKETSFSHSSVNPVACTTYCDTTTTTPSCVGRSSDDSLAVVLATRLDTKQPAPVAVGAESKTVPEVCEMFIPLLELHLQCKTNYAFVKYHLTRTFPEFRQCKKVQTHLQSAKSTQECMDALRALQAAANGNVEGAGSEGERKRPRD